jgi:hypothetical protein
MNRQRRNVAVKFRLQPGRGDQGALAGDLRDRRRRLARHFDADDVERRALERRHGSGVRVAASAVDHAFREVDP